MFIFPVTAVTLTLDIDPTAPSPSGLAITVMLEGASLWLIVIKPAIVAIVILAGSPIWLTVRMPLEATAVFDTTPATLTGAGVE
jgi:hypothetical protein